MTAHRYDDIDKLKETHEVMQLEGTAAGATALVEMLVHTHGGVTKVFPSTPEAWQDVSFRDVPQPGGFRVDAIRQRGQTQTVKIRSLRGGSLVLDVTDRKGLMLERDGKVSRVSFPFELEMRAGEEVVLRDEQ